MSDLKLLVHIYFIGCGCLSAEPYGNTLENEKSTAQPSLHFKLSHPHVTTSPPPSKTSPCIPRGFAVMETSSSYHSPWKIVLLCPVGVGKKEQNWGWDLKSWIVRCFVFYDSTTDHRTKNVKLRVFFPCMSEKLWTASALNEKRASRLLARVLALDGSPEGAGCYTCFAPKQ